MIIDACVFLGDSLYGNSLMPQELIEKMDHFGIDKAVVRPFKPSDYNYDRANKYIAQVQKDYPRLIGFGRVNPLEKTAPEQVRAIRSYGLVGLHLHPWEDNFGINDPKVYPAIGAAREQKLPVYVSAGYPNVSEPLQLWELADLYPDVTFIATHSSQLDMSGLSFDDALESAKRAKNIYFDLSGVYRRDFIELLINTAGQDHVLFGSCVPYMDFSLEIGRIRAAQIAEELKDRLFHVNVEKLLAP
jgi:predicted TIM-barrel fold metal-dependent hydrolase